MVGHKLSVTATTSTRDWAGHGIRIEAQIRPPCSAGVEAARLAEAACFEVIVEDDTQLVVQRVGRPKDTMNLGRTIESIRTKAEGNFKEILGMCSCTDIAIE